jgi:hypothetical protein
VRATTIRFSSELWGLLEGEARKEGVSVAQYVRDAALFRIGYSAGARGDVYGPAEVARRRITSRNGDR